MRRAHGTATWLHSGGLYLCSLDIVSKYVFIIISCLFMPRRFLCTEIRVNTLQCPSILFFPFTSNIQHLQNALNRENICKEVGGRGEGGQPQNSRKHNLTRHSNSNSIQNTVWSVAITTIKRKFVFDHTSFATLSNVVKLNTLKTEGGITHKEQLS